MLSSTPMSPTARIPVPAPTPTFTADTPRPLMLHRAGRRRPGGDA